MSKNLSKKKSERKKRRVWRESEEMRERGNDEDKENRLRVKDLESYFLAKNVIA